MPVPQAGHLPFIAFRPFFMVTSAASDISFFALHLTQYASVIINQPPKFDINKGKLSNIYIFSL